MISLNFGSSRRPGPTWRVQRDCLNRAFPIGYISQPTNNCYSLPRRTPSPWAAFWSRCDGNAHLCSNGSQLTIKDSDNPLPVSARNARNDSVWLATLRGPASAVRDLVQKTLQHNDNVVVIELKPGTDWATSRATPPAGVSFLSSTVTPALVA